MTTPTPPSRRAARGNQGPYQRGNQREVAILDSLERLLETTPLATIGVDDIAKGAGISRSALYFYFRSRSEAFVALLHRTLTELSTPPQELLSSVPGRPAKEEITGLLRHVLRSWQEHGAVLRAAVESADEPDIDLVWRQAMQIYIVFLSEWITRHRTNETVTNTGHDPQDLAAALTWMVERNNYQRFRSGPPTPAEMERHVDTLTTIIVGSTGIADQQE